MFFLPISVWAANLELEELLVRNGELSIPFDKLNNEYTILLEKDVYHLDLEYKASEGIAVFVKNNENLQNNSVVTLSLTDEKKVVEYHFHILKEEEETTENVFLESTPEVETNFMMQYKLYIIPSVCFLLLFLLFKLLFKKRKYKK